MFEKKKKKNPLPSIVTCPEAPHALFARCYLFSSFSISISFYLRLGFLIFAPSSLSRASPFADSFTGFSLSCAQKLLLFKFCCLSKAKEFIFALLPTAERARERRLKTVYWDKERKHPPAFNFGLMQTLMGGHGCARLILYVCSSVWKNVFASHRASQCLISASYSAFHLWTSHPPLLPSSSRHCWSVWRVYKRLQGSVKLDRVRCNEKHARESYDIKCHTNTPRQTLQSFCHSICLPSSHTCNPTLSLRK